MPEQQYCLRWNNHHPNNVSVFSTLLYNELLVDVTIIAEGAEIHAHKLILSACSTYFQRIFIKNPCRHPIIVLRDVEPDHLKIIIDFIYHGEVNCTQDQLPEVLKIADMLKVKGLTEVSLMKNAPNQSGKRSSAANDAIFENDDDKETESVRPGPKRKLKTASFQTSRSPDHHEDTQRSNENDATEPEYSNDSVEAQPQSTMHEEQANYAEDMEQSVSTVDTMADQNSAMYLPDANTACDRAFESATTEDCREQIAYQPNHATVSVDPYTCQSTGTSYEAATPAVEEPHKTSNILSIAARDVLDVNCAPNILVHNVLQQPQPMVTLRLGYVERIINAEPEGQQVYMATDNSYHSSASATYNSTPSHVQPEQLNIRVPLKRGRPPRKCPNDSQNMHRAIEAVRQGMSFCRAARMFGVNNRSLWLEYKKMGYPSSSNRLQTIKSDAVECTATSVQPNLEREYI